MSNPDIATAADLIENQLKLPAVQRITPVLIVMVGLPGSGKSTLARAIAQVLPAAIVESDLVRKTLFSPATHSAQESQFVHRTAHLVIERLLRRGISTISDATNLIEFHREFLYRIADRCGARLLIVRVVAPEHIIQQRLEQRRVAPTPQDLSEADWNVYQHMLQVQEPIQRPYITVNTNGDFNEAVTKVLRAARRAPPPRR